MNLDDLEDALNEILPGGFSIESTKEGEIVIFTHLMEDDDGELVDLELDEDDDFHKENYDDEDEEFSDEDDDEYGD